MVSAYDILNMATTRQLRNLDQLRSDIREQRKLASAQSIGTGMEGGFYQDEISALEREYAEAKNDILADASTQRQIIAEQQRAAREAEKRRSRAGIGSLIGGTIGGVGGFLLGGPAGAGLGFNAGSQIGGTLGGY